MSFVSLIDLLEEKSHTLNLPEQRISISSEHRIGQGGYSRVYGDPHGGDRVIKVTPILSLKEVIDITRNLSTLKKEEDLKNSISQYFNLKSRESLREVNLISIPIIDGEENRMREDIALLVSRDQPYEIPIENISYLVRAGMAIVEGEVGKKLAGESANYGLFVNVDDKMPILWSIMTMQRIKGIDLNDLVAMRLEPIESYKILASIGDEMLKVWDNEIVHRDLKPSNIIVEENLSAHVYDFGSARLAGKDQEKFIDEWQKIIEKIGFGTPLYMSPEMVVSANYKEEDTKIDLDELLEMNTESSVKRTILDLPPGFLDFYKLTRVRDIYAYALIAAELIIGEHPYEKGRVEKVKDFLKYMEEMRSMDKRRGFAQYIQYRASKISGDERLANTLGRCITVPDEPRVKTLINEFKKYEDQYKDKTLTSIFKRISGGMVKTRYQPKYRSTIVIQ